MDDLPEVLVKPEAAKFLRLSQRSVEYLVASGSLPHVKTGRKSIRFRRDALREWLKKMEKGGDQV